MNSLLNQVHHAPAADLIAGIPPASIDLLLTDPPYDHEHDYCFDTLANAARILKSGGSLITLLGQEQVPYAINAISPFLRYNWIGWLFSNGTWTPLHGKRIYAGGKPWLWFVNGEQRINPRTFVCDTITSRRADKRYHAWGQSLDFPLEMIEKLTPPGGVVLDPFSGGGAFLAAAKMLGRDFIGGDSDALAVQVCRERLADIERIDRPRQLALLEVDRKEQSTLQRLQKKALRHKVKELRKEAA